MRKTVTYNCTRCTWPCSLTIDYRATPPKLCPYIPTEDYPEWIAEFITKLNTELPEGYLKNE